MIFVETISWCNFVSILRVKSIPSEEKIQECLARLDLTLPGSLLPDENLGGIGVINHGVGDDQIPVIVFVVAGPHAVEFSVTEKQFEFTTVLYVGDAIHWDHKLLGESHPPSKQRGKLKNDKHKNMYNHMVEI